MTTSDYLINGLLVLLVLRQIRGRRLAGWTVWAPLALVAYAAYEYLPSIPTGGNDLFLVFGATTLGLLLGTFCALKTRVYPDHDGVAFAKATGVAAVLWVIGVGARVGFGLYAQHGGGASIVRFDGRHDITTIETWVAALILMAIVEAVSRTAVLLYRAHTMPGLTADAPFAPADRPMAAAGGIMHTREG